MTLRRLVPRSATVTAVVVLLTVTAPAATAAGATGACAGSNGVTVVVDSRPLGGGITIRCAEGSPSTGIDALRRAGFTVRGTVRFPGFVCRIDDAPGSDPCLDTAPADAFWSYWHASRGGSWTYSDTGAAERTPPSGSVEGWVFSDGSGQPPGIAPPARPTPTTTVAPPPAAVAGATTVAPPTTRPQPAPGPVPPTVLAVPSGSEVSRPATEPAPVPDTTGAGQGAAAPVVGATDAGEIQIDPSDVGTVDPGAATSNGTDDERTDLLAAATPDGPDSGSPIATVFGAVIVAAVATTAFITYRRRRASTEPR